MKQYRHVITAVLAFVLCMGMMDKLVCLIDKVLMPILDHPANTWLNIFFIAFNLILGSLVWKVWIKGKKAITEKTLSWLLFIELVYWCFRAINEEYIFDTYWGSFVAYLDPIACFAAFAAIYSLFKKNKQSSESNIDNNSSERFHRDDAINVLDDDIFGLEGTVNRVMNYLKNTDVSENAYSIGLTGKWGEGKTSMMNLIKEKLSKNDFIIIDYNPRSSKDTEHIQSDFLTKLKLALTPSLPQLDNVITRYAETINIVDDTPDIISWLVKVFAIHRIKNEVPYRESIEEAIESTGKKLVVFVDDLDRLTGEELIEVMKVLVKNGAFINMFFVTAYDKEYVNSAISHYLGENAIINYTDKYFNTEIQVPIHAPHRLRSLLEQMLKEERDKGNITATDDQITFAIVSHVDAVSKRLKTVRDVKRFVNQFVYALKPVEEEIHFRDFFLLELIRFSHPEEYTNLHRRKYIHLTSGVTSASAVSSDLWYLNDELAIVKDQSINNELPESIDLLRELFPTESGYQVYYQVRKKRIYSVSSFEFYFYNYEYAHLTTKEANELLQMDLPQSFDELVRLSELYPKDVETALVTQDVTGFGDAQAIKRYFHIIVGALVIKNTSLNYIPAAFVYLRKEDVNKLIPILGLKNKEGYTEWIKKALLKLLAVNPRAVSNYTHHAINSYHEGTPTDYLYFSEQEMLDITVTIFKAYLDKISEDKWNVDQALSMSMVMKSNTHLYEEIADELRKSVLSHFNKYSDKLLFVGRGENAKASFQPFFRFDDVFPNRDEFEKLIFSVESNTAPNIGQLRAFWPIFKGNGYKDFQLTTNRDEEDETEYNFESETEYLNQYLKYDKEIDDLVAAWKNKSRLSECDTVVENCKSLQQKIKAIPLEIKLKEIYSVQLDDVITTVLDYKKHAADISDDIQNGDFVRFREDSYKGQDILLKEMTNAFTFQGKRRDGYCKLRELNEDIPIAQLQYIPIDGQSDSMIYYDPVVMASIVQPGQPVPVHHTNYTYFMNRFEIWKDGEKTFKQIVEEKGFQFVHEVQHWLREEMQDDGLKIHQTHRLLQ